MASHSLRLSTNHIPHESGSLLLCFDLSYKNESRKRAALSARMQLCAPGAARDTLTVLVFVFGDISYSHVGEKLNAPGRTRT